MSLRISLSPSATGAGGLQQLNGSRKSPRAAHRQSVGRSWEDQSDSDDDDILARAGIVQPTPPPSSSMPSSLGASAAALTPLTAHATDQLPTGDFHHLSPHPSPSPPLSHSGSSLAAAASKAALRSRVAEGMLVIDSLQIEKLKLQFRDPDTGRFDRALELREFVDAFSYVLGKTRKEFKHMFMKVDANSDGSIDWAEFLEFLAPAAADPNNNQREINNNITGEDTIGGSISFVRSRIGQVDHPCRGESKVSTNISPSILHSARTPTQPNKKSTFHTGMISKVLYLPTFDRYVTGGRDGLLKFWHAGDLQHVKTIKHSSCWISDVCYMKKSNRIAVCSMDRVITFYDPTSFEVVSRIRDVGSSRPLSSAPTCMDSSVIHNGEEEVLLIGDDSGNLLLYRMKSSQWHICDGRGGVTSCTHHAENTAKNYSDHVTVAKMVGLHEDWITSVKYDSRLGMVITSSLDRTIKQCDINKMTEIGGNSSGSGVGSAVDGALDSSAATGGSASVFGMEDIIRRTFSGHKKGIYSFDYSKKYKFMASCGLERKILLWDPFTCKLISTLQGHASSVQQVIISDEKSLLISLDFFKYIKIWNLKQDSHNLLNIQTLYEVDTHATGIPRKLGRAGGGGGGGGGGMHGSYRPDNRIGVIFFDAHHQRLLSCDSRITVFNARTLRDHGPKSHKFPIVAATYISNFNQVISGDTSGTIQVWDVDTGVSVFKFESGLKLTSMTFDSGRRRLLTGSQDGQLKMWNFSNGQGLMEFRNTRATKQHTTQREGAAASSKKDASGAGNEITALEYLTVTKAHSLSKYVLATGLDRKVTVYLEGDGEKHDALFTLPHQHQQNTSDARNKSAHANRRAHDPTNKAHPHSDSNVAAQTAALPAAPSSSSPSSTAGGAYSSASFKSQQGHRDDILCMVVCGGSHTIATGSYDGSICLWHFDSANFFAKLIPPPASTNQAFRKAANEATEATTGKQNTQKGQTSGAASTNSKKGVSFSTVASVAGERDDSSDGFTRYSPATSPWEELTPLIERAVEKLVWLDRQQLLVSAGADGIIRFWDVTRAVMLCDRLCRVGHTRSENILALKAVETVGSNWQQRLALQAAMEARAINKDISASILPGLQPAGKTNANAKQNGTPTNQQKHHQSTSAQDFAVAAINAIDDAPAVHYTFLLTGDSLGHLIVWDLSRLEFRFEKVENAIPTQPTSILANGERTATNNGSGGISAFHSVGRPVAERPVMVHTPHESILPIHHWQAHERASILSIDYLLSYKMVLTGGSDGRILLWTRGGDLVGMFGQSTAMVEPSPIRGAAAGTVTDGFWDLHQPETWKYKIGAGRYENRSKSDSDDTDDEVGVGVDAHDDGVSSSSPHSRIRRGGRGAAGFRPLSLAALHPPPATQRTYDESPPHTPIEDEGRTRSNTPDAEEQARTAAAAQKNKTSTVNSLAALGMQAIRDRENRERRDAGLPTLEEEVELAKRSDEEKQVDFSPAVGGRALGGVGSTAQSRRDSITGNGTTQSASGTNADTAPTSPRNTTTQTGSMRQSMRMSQTVTLKALLQSRRDSAGTVTNNTNNNVTSGDPNRPLAANVSTGRLSPSLRLGRSVGSLTPHAPTGSAPQGGTSIGGVTTASQRRHRALNGSTSVGIAGASASLCDVSVSASSFVPLLKTREGFDYFTATIFNKSISAAHPTNNVPPPRDTRDNQMVKRVVAREISAAAQIESDEEVDDFYSNEGGHASAYFHSGRSTSLHSAGVGVRDELDARRNKVLFGSLRVGRSRLSLPHQTDEDEDGDGDGDGDGRNSLGLIRTASHDTSLTSLSSFRKSPSGAVSHQVPVSQRMAGLSAANIRRRLTSLTTHMHAAQTTHANTSNGTYAAALQRNRRDVHDGTSGGAATARSHSGVTSYPNSHRPALTSRPHWYGFGVSGAISSALSPNLMHGQSDRVNPLLKPLGYLRDYPLVEVPYATRTRDEDNQTEEFGR